MDNQVNTYLNQTEAAAHCSEKYGLKISPKTLEKKRCIGGGPPFHKFGNKAVYSVAALEQWIAQQLGEPVIHVGAQK